MSWETSLFILSIAVVVLVIFTIPVLLQLRRTIQSLDATLVSLNQNLPQILKNVDYITENLRQSIHAVRATVEEAVTRSLPSILENVNRLSSTVGTAVDAVRSRLEDLSHGVKRFRGGLADIDERFKEKGKNRIAAGLITFAGLVKRFRQTLETFKS